MFQSGGLRWSSEQMPVCRQQGICAVLSTLPQRVIDSSTPVYNMSRTCLGTGSFLVPWPIEPTNHTYTDNPWHETAARGEEWKFLLGVSLQSHLRLQYKPTSTPWSFLPCTSGNTKRCTKRLRREYTQLWDSTTKGNTVYPPTTLINLKAQSKQS